MAMKIYTGSTRSTGVTTQGEIRYCEQCPNDSGALGRTIAEQWVESADKLPPSKAVSVLYLAYSPDQPSGTVRYGHYNRRRRQFIEQGSGDATPKDRVVAWLPVPSVPAAIYQKAGPKGLPDPLR